MNLLPRDIYESLLLALAVINTAVSVHRIITGGDGSGPLAFSLACLVLIRVHRIEVHLNERHREDIQ